MLQVNEIINLTLFKEFNLIAGQRGLTNQTNNIVILEYEPINNRYDVFHEGDFVLSSLFFAKDRPDLIIVAFKELIKRKISGIAIKTVFFDNIPDDVMKIAEAHKLPVFLFETAYMEDLILSANELLKTKLQFVVFEEKITNLIQNYPSPYKVNNTLKEINPEFHPNIITAYITSTSNSGANTIHSYFQRLTYKKYKTSNQYSYSYVKYRSGMLLIYTFPDSNSENMEPYQNTVSKLLKYIDINPDYFYIGINDTPATHEKLDVSIKQAIYTNRICQLNSQNIMLYSKLGIYQLLSPLVEDHTVYDYYMNAIETLKDYDTKYTSNLLDTMIIYIKYNGDISKTAGEIYQHPNTARYRLKKACSLLCLDESNYYEQMYIIIKLYLLNEISSAN